MRRSCLLFAVLAMLVLAPGAWAGGGDHPDGAGHGHEHGHGHGDRATIVPAGRAGSPLLTAWWKEPLSKSADDPTSPFVSGGCRQIARRLALDYGTGTTGQGCTVPAGTWVFEVGFTAECSNIEPDPYHAETPREAALCGLRIDRMLTAVTLAVDDGEPVSLLDRRFGAFLFPSRVVVPENGVFGGTPGEIMRYGGHGYVALIRPLPVGEHTVHLHLEGTVEGVPPEGVDVDSILTVTPR